MKSFFSDFLIASGIALVSYGAFMIYEPCGYIVAGALLLWIGILSIRNRAA